MTIPQPTGQTPVRVRFAPSPTGELHLGGLRTALFNHLFRLQRGGSLVLRIEDTDARRNLPEAEERLIEDLRWGGIRFDEGFQAGGDRGSYRQSQRGEIYREHIPILLERRVIYPCWCSQERIAELHSRAAAQGKPPRYDRRCRSLPPAEHHQMQRSPQPFVYRLATPLEGEIRIRDLVKGEVVFNCAHLDDPVLVRSDGRATGLLAGALDDHLMGISHVIRGDEWLPSTPYQAFVHRGLGGGEPAWAHLPLLLDETRAKLSKRRQGATVSDLRRAGFLPGAVMRYLTALGRGNLPRDAGYSAESLADAFNIRAYHSGECVFSLDALKSENAHAMRRMSAGQVATAFNAYLAETSEGSLPIPGNRFTEAVALFREETTTLADLKDEIARLLETPQPGREQLEIYSSCQHLLELVIATTTREEEELDPSGWKKIIKSAGAALNLSGRNLYMPLRLALTGSESGPELPRIMHLLGAGETCRRLESALATLQQS